jgi:hypothetical protein
MSLVTTMDHPLEPGSAPVGFQNLALADGMRELTAEELELIAGGFSFAALEQAALIGVVGGGAGGLVTGLFAGGPVGALSGAAIGALAGAVGGAATSAVAQLLSPPSSAAAIA